MGGGIVVVLDREFLVWFTRNLEWSEISCIFHHPQNGSFRSHQILKVNCQRTCLMSFSSENREKTLRFVLTFHGQATDRLPTHYQQSADCRPTGSLYFRQNLSAVCRPTGFLGSSSSQLPKLIFLLLSFVIYNTCSNFNVRHTSFPLSFSVVI